MTRKCTTCTICELCLLDMFWKYHNSANLFQGVLHVVLADWTETKKLCLHKSRTGLSLRKPHIFEFAVRKFSRYIYTYTHVYIYYYICAIRHAISHFQLLLCTLHFVLCIYHSEMTLISWRHEPWTIYLLDGVHKDGYHQGLTFSVARTIG